MWSSAEWVNENVWMDVNHDMLMYTSEDGNGNNPDPSKQAGDITSCYMIISKFPGSAFQTSSRA